jgi:hypothetical protein
VFIDIGAVEAVAIVTGAEALSELLFDKLFADDTECCWPLQISVELSWDGVDEDNDIY